MRNLFLVLALLMLTTASWAGNKAAVVKLIKGEAYVGSGDKKVKLKVDDWLESGSVLHTSSKSFVKLVFIDKSQMNIGPQSEIKIERFHSKDAGVIDLVKGKIRSQVSKDYLQINGKDRSKLFIKTNNSVMGIRGTDFMISTNGKNTAAILFEGEVVFNRLDDRKISDSKRLDEIVDRGVRLFPGEFSAVGEKGLPTIPALLNVHQREKLEKNGNFDKAASNSSLKITKSIVPAGLSGAVVSSKPGIQKNADANNDKRASSNPDSFLKNGQIKPANGSFVHVDSASIISPGSNASLDENSNTYIASPGAGSVAADGAYVPPVGVDINTSGNLIVTDSDTGAAKEIQVTTPIVNLMGTTNEIVGTQLEQIAYGDKEAVAAANAAKKTPETTSNDTTTDPAGFSTIDPGTTVGGTVGGTTGSTVGVTSGGTVVGVSAGTVGVTSGGTVVGVVGGTVAGAAVAQ